MKTTKRIHYLLESLDPEAAAAWSVALLLTSLLWGAAILTAGRFIG